MAGAGRAHADLKILDPIWTTACITRNHGDMIHDTLFALDASLRLRPQMVDKHTVTRDPRPGPSARWPTDEAMEKLRTEFTRQPDPARRKSALDPGRATRRTNSARDIG